MSESPETLLKARINDLFSIVQQKNYAKYTSFLNESEVYFAKSFIEANHYNNYLFYGGCNNNKRKILGIFPEHHVPDKKDFPIIAMKIMFSQKYSLTHRDFLGSLMSLNITRDSIGDIIILDNGCGIFLRDSVALIVQQELKKVGSVGVNVTPATLSDYDIKDEFKELTGTVSSFRLDSILAFICRVSRGNAVSLIRNGMVKVNYTIVQNNHFTISALDLLSVRGYGKYIIDDRIVKTKKERYWITVKQFI